MSDALPYARVTRFLRLLGDKNYLNNYFAMYTRLPRSRLRVYLESPAFLVLRWI